MNEISKRPSDQFAQAIERGRSHAQEFLLSNSLLIAGSNEEFRACVRIILAEKLIGNVSQFISKYEIGRSTFYRWASSASDTSSTFYGRYGALRLMAHEIK